MRRRSKKGTLLTRYLANELATEVMSKDDHAHAVVGTHVTNGEERTVVHVTYYDNVAKPRTIARA